MEGVRTAGVEAAPANPPPRRKVLEVEDYVKGVAEGNLTILGRAITLVESNAPLHQAKAQLVLQELLPQTGRAKRIGITGIPGAGKSTFIEALGCHLTRQGRRVAVLAIDPSSTRTGGSILADKVRMEKLGRDPNAFIRPSPAGGSLGGVARKTREAIMLCEAAGYDVIIVETVGVGQSEITVRSMVDCFMVLMIAGAGDEMQGIKKRYYRIGRHVGHQQSRRRQSDPMYGDVGRDETGFALPAYFDGGVENSGVAGLRPERFRNRRSLASH